MATFVARMHVVLVKIPIEVCTSLLHETAEKLLFNFLHHVEPHKNVVVIVKINGFIGGNAAVKGSFVSNAQLKKSLVEDRIYIVETTP